jgi:predicted DNA-binding transcriptional regulator AlpA
MSAAAVLTRQLVTILEVMALTGMSRVTIRRWLRDGSFPPPLRTNGRKKLFWSRAVVEAFLAGKDWRKMTAAKK